jgi:hypothetical protein
MVWDRKRRGSPGLFEAEGAPQDRDLWGIVVWWELR